MAPSNTEHVKHPPDRIPEDVPANVPSKVADEAADIVEKMTDHEITIESGPDGVWVTKAEYDTTEYSDREKQDLLDLAKEVCSSSATVEAFETNRGTYMIQVKYE